jgi:hypothetical protein
MHITQPFLPGITVGGVPLGHEAFIRQYMSTLTAGFVSYIRSTIHQLQPASSFATWSSCLYTAIQTRLDFWLQHLTPEETEVTCHTVDAELRDAVEGVQMPGTGGATHTTTSPPPGSVWERVEAESGSLGAASSESAAGSGRPRACGCSVGRGFGLGRRADVRVVCWWVWIIGWL